MKHLRHWSLALGLLLTGCASAPTTKLAADDLKEQAAIRQRLDQIIDAAQKKDFERLDSYHLYGPKFTKFAGEAPGRLDAAAARQGEHAGLGAVEDLSMRAEDVKVDVFGQAAVATFILDYSFKAPSATVQRQVRSTLIFVKENGDWKIAHEHLSPARVNP